MGKRKFEYSDNSDSEYSSSQRSGKKTRRSVATLPSAVVTHLVTTHIIKEPDIAPLRTALVQWYATVHESRNMPWRKPYNPHLGPEERAQRAYEVWVSEVMLQQTQVATVIPYYNRWIDKFPTIHELADASIDEVNALWKGLGYYTRASRLLAGAKKAVSEFNGKLPDNAKDLQTHIPGIGRYSAGAISSIAYGEHAPVLDGNVTRLLSRLLALHAPPKGKLVLDILWNAATTMVEDVPGNVQHPGDVNQALIELGSTVCKVRDPNCDGCPVQPWCKAKTGAIETQLPDIEDLCKVCLPLPANADVTSYPSRVEKKKAREELDVVCVVEWRKESDRRFLLVRRPEEGLLAGLDGFPTLENVSVSLSAAKLLKMTHQLLPNLLKSSKIKTVESIGDVVHVFSHIKKTYRVHWAVLEETPHPPQPIVSASTSVPPLWVPSEEVASKNIGTGVVKIWNLCQSKWRTDV